MILVKSVETLTVDEDPVMVHSLDKIPVEPGAGPPGPPTYETEYVHGREYHTPNGRKVIGFAKGVPEEFAIPLEAYHQVSRERNALQDRFRELENAYYSRQVEIDTAGFWKRLKYLFTKQI